VGNPTAFQEEIPMLRIKHTVSTIAVVVATAGLIAPAAQAKGEPPFPSFAPREHAVPTGTLKMTIDRFPLPTARGVHGGWLEHRALANSANVPKAAVNGRAVSSGGGIDWTFPVMGAVALVLVMMILGEQVLVRRGRLAT
jgi:hypothetical protein